MLHLSKADLSNFNRSLSQEWLDTNKRGTYASSNVLDCPTRRYHGLLISDAGYLPDKHVWLAKFEASLSFLGRTIDLYCNKHPGSVFFPEGHNHMESFDYSLFPSTRYRAGSLHIERSQMLLYEKDVVLIRYRVLGHEPVSMSFRPLLALRSHHQLRSESMEVQGKTYSTVDGLKIEALPAKPALYMSNNLAAKFYAGPLWVKKIEYAEEQARGFDYQEDLFCPGFFEIELPPEQDLIFAIGLESLAKDQLITLWNEEEARRQNLRQSFASDGPTLAQLKFEAEKFIIQRPDGSPSIVAGYPWFGEWGRDTMIALPGLTLGRGRPELLLPIVHTYLSKAQDGFIPNYLGHGSALASYNSVDAVLWMFASLQEYAEQTADWAGLIQLLPELSAAIDSIINARHSLCTIDSEGLLRSGSKATQLTWMDAAVDGMPVTPRDGYAVELNALWLNALIFTQEIAQKAGQISQFSWPALLEKAPRAFQEKFWLEERGYLADSVAADGRVDTSMRPNQILAVSLAFSPLNTDQQRSVMDRVTSQLLTPVGLRTLAEDDPAFVPFYMGGPAARDRAYHQGTVWPWLIAPYAKAMLKVSEPGTHTENFLRQNLCYLWQDHLKEAGIMGVSEIFDSCYPFLPNGCIFQAWSMASVIAILNLLKNTESEWR